MYQTLGILSYSSAVTPSTKYYATWNPYAANAGSTFSNGYLTADVTGNGSIRANVAISSGKWYWEVTLDSTGAAGNTSIGVANSSSPLNNYTGQTTDGWGAYDKASLISGGYLHGGTVGAGLNFQDYVAGDVLGFALDMGTGDLDVYLNGVLMDTMPGVTGTVYPSFGDGGSGVHTAVTANFGGSAFTYSVPSGYNAGVYTTTYEPDATAFFNYVTGLGGTLSTTEKDAYHQFVLDCKAASIYYNLKAIYPMIGASATACAGNGTTPGTFDLTFYGSPTFASTGVSWNGTSQYADTGINASSLSTTTNGISYYSRTNDVSSIQVEFGASNNVSKANDLVTRLQGLDLFYYENPTGITASNTDSRGLFSGHRLSGGTVTSYKNGIQQATASQSSDLPNLNIFIGVRFDGSTYQYYTKKECALAAVFNVGLTSDQEADWYASVQAFQTTLSRQIGTAYNQPDSDAQTFLTAGSITRPQLKYAWSNFVTSAKANSYYSKFIALYPFIGGTAGAHAVNAKNPGTYDITFVGSPTHGATGVTFNGSTQYGTTGLVPNSISMTQANNMLALYSRTSTATGVNQYYDMGSGDNSVGGFAIYTNRSVGGPGGAYDSGNGVGGRIYYAANADGSGRYIGTVDSGTGYFYKNGSLVASGGVSGGQVGQAEMYVGAFQEVANGTTTLTNIYYSPKEFGMFAFGNSFTTTDAGNFDTDMAALQTQLNR